MVVYLHPKQGTKSKFSFCFSLSVSLLLALLSLIFLLKISPGGRDPPPPPPGPTAPEDYAIVYDVTLALCALSLSLNLCCLLVCAIQFLFAVKLVRAPATTGRYVYIIHRVIQQKCCSFFNIFVKRSHNNFIYLLIRISKV